MDAVSLQGIWTSFPAVINSGRLHYAAGLLKQMMYEETRRNRGKPKESPEQLRYRLMKAVEDRIIEEDADDWISILAV